MSVVQQQEGMVDLIPCNEQCGGDYEHYSFGQTDKEVVVTIPVDQGTTSKAVSIHFTPSTLNVTIRGKGTILSGKLFKPIRVSESTWFLQDHKEVIVTLSKTNFQYEEWWPLVVEGERQIDMKTLKPPAVHVSELDDGARATVARMMYDQQQKRLGN